MGGAALLSELFSGPAGIVGDGFIEIAQFGERVAKRAGAGDFCLRCGCIVQVDAGRALLLPNLALQHDRPLASDGWLYPVEQGLEPS